MKKIIQITALITTFILVPFSTASAQYTSHLRSVELLDFNQVNVNSDVKVILKKSKRNQVSFSGDSASISLVNITQLDGILSFDYVKGAKDSLAMIVIEYKDLEKITTGGIGTYYIPGLELDNLHINNPEANIYMSGYTKVLRIVSRKGINDLTDITSSKMILQIGDDATLIDTTIETLFSSLD